jgi:hypothetical protein
VKARHRTQAQAEAESGEASAAQEAGSAGARQAGAIPLADNPEADAEALAINAQPWEPLPGMVKLRCIKCHYWFAARDPATESVARFRNPNIIAVSPARRALRRDAAIGVQIASHLGPRVGAGGFLFRRSLFDKFGGSRPGHEALR